MYDKLRHLGGGRLSYVMVYETHKSGSFHVHALVSLGEQYDLHGVEIAEGLSRQEKVKAEKKHPFCRWLKKKAVDAKAGWVCHATRIQEGPTGGDNARLAVGYISKYFTKGSRGLAMPKRWRRLGASQDIGSPKTKGKGGFTWAVRHAVLPADTKRIDHYLINEGRLLEPSDFGDTGMYPSPEADE